MNLQDRCIDLLSSYHERCFATLEVSHCSAACNSAKVRAAKGKLLAKYVSTIILETGKLTR